jgi:hypothetical protein
MHGVYTIHVTLTGTHMFSLLHAPFPECELWIRHSGRCRQTGWSPWSGSPGWGSPPRTPPPTSSPAQVKAFVGIVLLEQYKLVGIKGTVS